MIRWLHALIIVLALALLTAITYHARTGPALTGGDEVNREMPAGHPPTGAAAPQDLLSPVPQNRPAPAFVAMGRDGKPHALASFRGQTVLLNFWATWCGPCKDELPHLAILAQALRGSPVQLVLVSVDKRWSEVDALTKTLIEGAPDGPEGRAWREAAAMLKGEMPNVTNLLDPGAGIPASYGTQKFPETFLIDTAGQIRSHFIGPKAWAHPQAIQTVRALIGGQGPAPAASPDAARATDKVPGDALPPGHPPLDNPGAPDAKKAQTPPAGLPAGHPNVDKP